MDTKEILIANFYSAFQNLDAEEMVSYYHRDIIFEDPAFGQLRGERAKNMWRMLCSAQKGKNFIVKCSNIIVEENKASANWEAQYVFSRTGRGVHNRIKAEFEFLDDKIVKHTDHFSVRKWAGMAMGWKGNLVGGTSFFKNKLMIKTNGLLDDFEMKRKSLNE